MAHERMVTGEREQRAAARMLKGCCREPSLTERGRTRPLSRIVEAAKSPFLDLGGGSTKCQG
jgi:hypothetical protein